MGLTISANKCPIELNGGYGMFLRLRIRIAQDWDKEFGDHYSNVGKCCFNPDYAKVFDAKTKEIVSQDRFADEDYDLFHFFFMSDCEGKINHKLCKKILDVIKDDNKELNLVYDYWSDGHDWQHFKELLQWCYSHRANMYWR